MDGIHKIPLDRLYPLQLKFLIVLIPGLPLVLQGGQSLEHLLDLHVL
jgi:hypothetical protein